MTTLSIIGAGAWGTALACAAREADNNVSLYTNNKQEFEYFTKNRESIKLKGLKIHEDIRVFDTLEDILPADVVLLVVPAQEVRQVCTELNGVLNKQTYIILCSKGVELESGLMMHEIAESVLKDHSIAVLSGPTFAHEVAQKMPTAALIAHKEMTTARFLASTLGSDCFRLYPSSDIVGAEIGGAVKNVIAIAVGIAMAKKMGDNARAAIITRGLAEMARLGVALGADHDTFLGLSGVGDLVLTCTSKASRNFSFGFKKGGGNIDFDDTLLTEGAHTVLALMRLADMMEIEMPLSRAVHRVLYENANIENEIHALLSRPFKVE